jgi:hypothetical protein
LGALVDGQARVEVHPAAGIESAGHTSPGICGQARSRTGEVPAQSENIGALGARPARIDAAQQDAAGEVPSQHAALARPSDRRFRSVRSDLARHAGDALGARCRGQWQRPAGIETRAVRRPAAHAQAIAAVLAVDPCAAQLAGGRNGERRLPLADAAGRIIEGLGCPDGLQACVESLQQHVPPAVALVAEQNTKAVAQGEQADELRSRAALRVERHA